MRLIDCVVCKITLLNAMAKVFCVSDPSRPEIEHPSQSNPNGRPLGKHKAKSNSEFDTPCDRWWAYYCKDDEFFEYEGELYCEDDDSCVTNGGCPVKNEESGETDDDFSNEKYI